MTVLTKETKGRKCKECGERFFTRNPSQKYCTVECSKKARHDQTVAKTPAAAKRNQAKFKKEYGDKIGKLTLKCATCKQPYDVYQSQVKYRGSTYCSMECKAIGMIKAKTKPKLVRELDAVYSRYIREKYADGDQVKCVTCNKSDEIKNMQNGHYVSRRFHATRWLDKNCHPQCYSCNVGLGGNYAHYTRFMINTYGAGVVDELIELSGTSPNYSKLELAELIDKYKKEL